MKFLSLVDKTTAGKITIFKNESTGYIEIALSGTYEIVNSLEDVADILDDYATNIKEIIAKIKES